MRPQDHAPAGRRVAALMVLSLLVSLLAVGFDQSPALAAPGVTVTPGTLDLTEAADGTPSDTYDVVLTEAPAGTVTITVAAGSSGEFAVDQTELTFTTGDWFTPQTVTVTASDDDVDDGDTNNQITHSASGGGYDSASISPVTVNVADDDTAGVFINDLSLYVEETGAILTDTYRVRLESEPTGDVTITMTVDPTDGIDVTAVAQNGGAASLTFTPLNWSALQTVLVTAVDDPFEEVQVEPETITHSASGGGYDLVMVPTVDVNVWDTDDAGIIFDEGGGVTATEGGTTGTYSVALGTEPTANVTITLSPQGSEATAVAASGGASTLEFTPSDWDEPQSVTVTAIDDMIADGATTETIDHVFSSSDPFYDSGTLAFSTTTVSVDITDNDTAGVTVTPTSVSVTEGGATATYNVKLNAEPSGSVTITLDPQGTEATAVATIGGGTTLLFGTGDWGDFQEVTVTAVDDSNLDGTTEETIDHSASGGGYDGVAIASVTVAVNDNDSYRIDIAGTPMVSEPSGTDTYDVVLTEAPSGEVTVELSEFSAEFNIASATTLTFDVGNWSLPQSVTVAAVDDDIADGSQTGVITHIASGGGYDVASPAEVEVTVDDDDEKGISISKPAVAVAEGGAPVTYTVGLDSEPTGTVMVAVDVSNNEAAVDKTDLTFTPGNWDTPQTVTVEASNDSLADGDTSAVIAHSAAGADYHNLNGPAVTVTIADDDKAGVTLTESGVSTIVAEGGTTDTYRVVLDAEPLADVVVTAIPDAQVGVTPTSVTFTPGNWDQPRNITVRGIEDSVDEADPHTGVIQHTTSSSDPQFDALAVADLAVSVVDANVTLVSIQGPGFGAPGVTATFTTELVSGNTGPVTYEWEARRGNTVVGTGDKAKFEFAPTGGGEHTVSVAVFSADSGNAGAVVDFRVLGDIGDSLFVRDILWLAAEGITLGCNPPANDEYCPDDPVTRGQMAAFLDRFLELTDDGGGNRFVDDDGSVFEDAIARLAAAEITRGCNPPDNDRFCPDDPVTRGQMAAFLVRALGLTDDGGGNRFVDDDGSVFEDAIAAVGGCGDHQRV